MGTQCVACFRGKMLAIILLLNLILCISDAKSSPKSGLEDLENLVEKLESRLRDMETRLEETERRLESKDKEMERMEQNNQDMKTRLEELEDKMRNENDVFEKRNCVKLAQPCSDSDQAISSRLTNSCYLCLAVQSHQLSPNSDI